MRGMEDDKKQEVARLFEAGDGVSGKRPFHETLAGLCKIFGTEPYNDWLFNRIKNDPRHVEEMTPDHATFLLKNYYKPTPREVISFCRIFELNIEQSVDFALAAQNGRAKKTVYRYNGEGGYTEGATNPEAPGFYDRIKEFLRLSGSDDDKFKLQEFARKTGLRPWVIQGFQPLPYTIPAEYAAMVVAGHIANPGDTESVYNSALEYFKSVVALDVVGGQKGGIPLEWGELNKTLMEYNGISSARLAEALGIAPSTIRKWERGSAVPDGDILDSLVGIYGLSGGVEKEFRDALKPKQRPWVARAARIQKETERGKN